MVVSIDKICNGIVCYAEKEIAQKTTGIQKFITYMYIPSLPNEVKNIVSNYRPMLERYFDENGNVNIDMLYSDSKVAMQKTLEVEFKGIRFKENDIDMLYKYIIQ